MSNLQQTIVETVIYSGMGVHSGINSTITLKPAPPHTGLIFIRSDLPQASSIPAKIEYVVGTERGTTIGIDEAKVATIEHLLAAVVALGIDNLYIEVDAEEIPFGDGSSKPFVELLQKAGKIEQDATRNFLSLDRLVTLSEDGIQLVASPHNSLRLSFTIDFHHPVLKSQYTSFEISPETFIKEIAPARTFCLENDVQRLRQQGLIKGGTLNCAIVIGEQGIVNPEPLRYPDEFVRHKIIDLLGDLALLGQPLKAHLLAIKSGHRSHIKFVRELKKVAEEIEKKKQGPVFDINAILQLMPHRYPFLLVDRILELEEKRRVVGIKNVTLNEPFFPGHFPGRPLMPGVLIIEAMAQVGGFLLLHSVENPENKLVIFMEIDKAKFRRPVVPGDQIRFELEMVKLKGRICKMTGKAYVENNLVAEAQLMAMVIEK
ncbi:MAG: bifunctional UDP-3-O-[3-hydroxymyristoyl] N-acetylglucosamine deacetylase/3-hydroxyacyl-ACP dehydratase [Candidatus Edwardsbacteria bacterium]